MKYGIEYRDGYLYIATTLGIYKIESYPGLGVWKKESYAVDDWEELNGIELSLEEGFVGIFAILEEGFFAFGDDEKKIYNPTTNSMNLPREFFVLPILNMEFQDRNQISDKNRIPISIWFPSKRSIIQKECQKFLKSIPEEYLNLVSGIRSTQHNHKFKLIKAFKEDIRFYQLFLSNKRLAFYYLFVGDCIGLMKEGFYSNLLNRKQKEIGEALGFKSDEVNILKKLDYVLLHDVLIRNFMNLFRIEKYKNILRSLSNISISAYRFLRIMEHNGFYPEVTYSFMRDLNLENLFRSFNYHVNVNCKIEYITFRNHILVYDYLEILKLAPDIKIKNLSQLHRIHNKYKYKKLATEVYNSRITFDHETMFGGNEYIEPIHTEIELFEETTEQVHCCYDYKDSILAGEHLFFRVLYPERATLALVKEGKYWIYYDLKGKQNKPVSEITWAFVKDWLDENGIYY